MILVPLSLNILQFWIQDTFLKGDTVDTTYSNMDDSVDDSRSPPPVQTSKHITNYLEINDSEYTSL